MDNRVAVLKTLLYSDIFDYPLTKEEVWYYLIADKKINPLDFSVKNIKEIDFKNNFYFLKGRKNLPGIRKKREKLSLLKLRKAKKITRKLSFISTIKFIGISGNLALKNAEKDDDIDLFIVTKKNTIWLTRLLVVVVLKFLRIYRKKADKHVKDKICTNMFLDEQSLRFSKKRKNIFTAHELSQLIKVVDKKNTYQKLILKNKWAKEFLPNIFSDISELKESKEKDNELANSILILVNNIVKVPQILYMKKHQTTEEISDKILAFHPKDHCSFVLGEYQKRLQKYGL